MKTDFTVRELNRFLQTPGIVPTVLEEVDSTNRVAKDEARRGAPEGRLILASRQNAGRGRLGRTFFSPDATGLYMSLILRPTFGAADAQMITTGAAVATARAISEVCGRETGIKWVNDLFLGDRKVCGILTESAILPGTDRLDFAVLGIGVNLKAPADGFPQEIAGIAGALYGVGEEAPSRMRLAAAIVDRFFVIYPDLTKKTFLPEYRRRSVLDGKPVTVSDGQGHDLYAATVIGIDDDLGLRVYLSDGTERVLSAGEVSVKA